jgi:FkbM family methyltransferase
MFRSVFSRLPGNVLNLYATFFAKKSMVRINKLLFLAGARGLGILNYQNSNLSGEEPFLKSFLANYDSNEFLVLDVGANKGQFAEHIVKNTKSINVRSYEPNPHACHNLKSNPLFKTSRHTLVEMGASNTISESFIYDYSCGLGSGHSSLYREVITDLHKSTSATSEKVLLTTLDSDLKELSPNIAVLKIDTEGHEKAVLEGAKNILATNPPVSILIEFNEMNAISGVHYRD